MKVSSFSNASVFGCSGVVLKLAALLLSVTIWMASLSCTKAQTSTNVPVFQFAVFYNGLMEFTWNATLTVRGRTHANSDIYVGTPANQTFGELVTTSGGVFKPAWAGHTPAEYTGLLNFSGTPAPGYITNYPRFDLPIGVSNTPAVLHSIIEIPLPGEDPSAPLAQQRYYNKAGIVMLVSNTTVTAMIKSSMIDTPTNLVGYFDATNANGIKTNFPFLTVITSTNFVDARENKFVLASQIDVNQLRIWLLTNNMVNGKFPNLAGVYDKDGPIPNIMYIADFRTITAAQMLGIRLTNGVVIPTNMTSAGVASGFTVATPNPIYVWGNYNCPVAAQLGSTNTSGTCPASLIGDAITLLSGAWRDSNSGGSLGSRSASSTTVNAAMLAGIVYSTGPAQAHYSGGVMNLPRLLEDWSSVTLTLNTSIVNLYNSVQAPAQFVFPGTYFYAPNVRNFNFDANFLDFRKLPPGTPILVTSGVPTIASQPQNVVAIVGQTVNFNVAAVGVGDLGYQWQLDGGIISGATSSTLTITNISDSDAASYLVVVSNSYGSVTSSIATLTVVHATEPTNVLTLAGSSATFAVSLTGTASFHYQWQFNGGNLLNATNATFTIFPVGTNDAGFYSVVISNMAGSVTSSNAALIVVLSPRSQTNYAGSTVAFTAGTYGPELLNYQWQKNGVNIADGGNLSGTTTSTLTIASISDSDAADYSAVVSDATGSVTTSNAVLTVNDSLFIVTQPQSQTVGLGSNATFSVTVYGASPFVFQWYFNGTPLGSPATGTNVSSFTLPHVGINQAGNYSVQIVNDHGSLTSSNAVLIVKVFPPSIDLQPLSLNVIAGSNASFRVTVSGSPPFHYQWQFNGNNLLNATNDVYEIQAVGTNNAGNYAVVVTNAADIATSSNAFLTVIVPPTLELQPSNQSVILGNSVTFSVSVSGSPPFHYQWQFNGNNLLSATNDVYVIQAAGTNNAGNYAVVITNAAGSTTSSNAFLTVIVPPTLELQPSNQNVILGNSVSFSVAVSGSSPFHYQWQFNGNNLLNATNDVYVIQAAGTNNAGNYAVVITNVAGSATSSNALLTVTVPPTLGLQIWAGYPLLTLNGMLSSNFVVQYSPNLSGTNWLTLLSLTNLQTSPYQFLDSGGISQPARFYRAIMQ
jgi:hypothetical protein